MTNIKQVRIEIQMADGTVLHFIDDLPGPRGDNPRFLVQQFLAGLKNVAARAEMAIKGAYPHQIEDDKARMFFRDAPKAVRREVVEGHGEVKL